jgi:arylsulfatase A-like enzyme
MRLGLQCGVVRPWAQYGLPLDQRTLPQALREVGYETAICGKWHLGHVAPEYLPTRRGFDHQYGHYNGALDYFTHSRDGGHDWHRNDEPNYDAGYTTELIAEEASRIITAHDQSTPLFLYVPFNAPHAPLQVPQKYIDLYAHLPDKDRRIHAGMVHCLDDAIGRILAALEKSAYPPQRTLLVFCSDNGGVPSVSSNGALRAGKSTLYEGGVRVPTVMVWKEHLKAGGVVEQPLHVVDMYPTLLRLSGAELAQQHTLDGQDAWPAIAEGQATPHSFILHNVTPFHGALRAGNWKLVHNGHVNAGATKASERETWELFDIGKDVGEKHDLSQRYPEVVEQLKQQLQTLAQEAAPPHIAPNERPKDFRAPQVWGHAGAEP